MSDLLLLANGLVLAVVLSQLASLYFFRLDLTEEKRYTIKQPTKDLLRRLDDDVYVEVYLEGDLNAGFRRLNKSIRETLEEFRIYSDNKVHYTFINPALAIGQNAQREFMSSLASKGIQPMNIIATKDGQRSESLVFPGAVISYAGEEAGVMLVKGNRSQGSEEALNQSIENIEFEMINAIHKLSNIDRKRIGLVTGHGELDSIAMASLASGLLESYDVFTTKISNRERLKNYDALIIAKPTRLFSEQDKFNLDQYLLSGGKVLMFLDPLSASMDSASRENYFAAPYLLGLEDQLFRYGVRVNPDIIQDRVSMRYPIVTGVVNGKPQMTPIEWPFFPLVNHYADHSITRNLDASTLKFASDIDSVKATGIRKTPLMFSSQYSRKIASPVKINVNDLRKENPAGFSEGPYVFAYLLEGKFTSLYKNRFLPEGVDSAGLKYEGVDSKLIVVADGDIAKNDINLRSGQPQPLGFDFLSGYTFANQELILNMIGYLVDDSGLINARNKEVKVRPLDKEKIKYSRASWQTINLVLPLALIVLMGLLKAYLRKKKYGSFNTVVSKG